MLQRGRLQRLPRVWRVEAHYTRDSHLNSIGEARELNVVALGELRLRPPPAVLRVTFASRLPRLRGGGFGPLLPTGVPTGREI